VATGADRLARSRSTIYLQTKTGWIASDSLIGRTHAVETVWDREENTAPMQMYKHGRPSRAGRLTRSSKDTPASTAAMSRFGDSGRGVPRTARNGERGQHVTSAAAATHEHTGRLWKGKPVGERVICDAPTVRRAAARAIAPSTRTNTARVEEDGRATRPRGCLTQR